MPNRHKNIRENVPKWYKRGRKNVRKETARGAKKVGLTLEQVAEIMSITYTTISRYENEKRKMDPETLVAFCKLYNVSADYILGLSEELPSSEKD